MRSLAFFSSSLMILTACTQPAAVVELRGDQDYSRQPVMMASNHTSPFAQTAQSSSSVPPMQMGFSQPVYNAERAQYDQVIAQDLPAPSQEKIASATPPATIGSLSPAAGDSKPVSMASKEVVLTPKDETPVAWKADAPKTSTLTTTSSVKSAYIWPVASEQVVSSFGKKGGGQVNDGLSIAADSGEPVWASADGEVVYVGEKMKGYGKMVIIKHGGNKTTTYAHLARYGVEKYDRVKQGDIIGYVGTTGSAKNPQLYFSMREGTQAIDPKNYLNRNLAGI